MNSDFQKISETFLQHIWNTSGRNLEDFWKISGRFLKSGLEGMGEEGKVVMEGERKLEGRREGKAE